MTNAYLGRWILKREIADHDEPSHIACAGIAVLRDDGDAIAYDESVTFTLDAKPMRATRAYRFSSTQRKIVATFADGRPFFVLRLDESGTGMATHPCGDDLYALTLTLREPDTWKTCWDVTGTKRLRIMTRFDRLPNDMSDRAEDASTIIAPYGSGRRSR